MRLSTAPTAARPTLDVVGRPELSSIVRPNRRPCVVATTSTYWVLVTRRPACRWTTSRLPVSPRPSWPVAAGTIDTVVCRRDDVSSLARQPMLRRESASASTPDACLALAKVPATPPTPSDPPRRTNWVEPTVLGAAWEPRLRHDRGRVPSFINLPSRPTSVTLVVALQPAPGSSARRRAPGPVVGSRPFGGREPTAEPEGIDTLPVMSSLSVMTWTVAFPLQLKWFAPVVGAEMAHATFEPGLKNVRVAWHP